MGSDPFPKTVENRQGDTLTVTSMAEQDAAAGRGYFRSLARKREFAEQQAQQREQNA